MELLYGEEEVKNLEIEKKLNLDQGNVKVADDSKQSGQQNTNPTNTQDNDSKKKKKSKGKNQDEKSDKPKSKKESDKSKTSQSTTPKGQPIKQMPKFAITNSTTNGSKNIFSVRSAKSNIQAMKCDSYILKF